MQLDLLIHSSCCDFSLFASIQRAAVHKNRVQWCDYQHDLSGSKSKQRISLLVLHYKDSQSIEMKVMAPHGTVCARYVPKQKIMRQSKSIIHCSQIHQTTLTSTESIRNMIRISQRSVFPTFYAQIAKWQSIFSWQGVSFMPNSTQSFSWPTNMMGSILGLR